VVSVPHHGLQGVYTPGVGRTPYYEWLYPALQTPPTTAVHSSATMLLVLLLAMAYLCVLACVQTFFCVGGAIGFW
jgi:hypothetical protein